MKHRFFALGMLVLAIAGCNALTVRETVLSSNQKFAMISNPGDGFTPPTNVILLEPGPYVPVTTGFAQAPGTAFLAGAGAGIAIGAGQYGAARVLRPSITNVVQNGASARSDASARARGGTGGNASISNSANSTNSNSASSSISNSGNASISNSANTSTLNNCIDNRSASQSASTDAALLQVSANVAALNVTGGNLSQQTGDQSVDLAASTSQQAVIQGSNCGR